VTGRHHWADVEDWTSTPLEPVDQVMHTVPV